MKKIMMSVVAAVAMFGIISSASAIHVFDPPWVQNPTAPEWAGGSTTSQGWDFGNSGAYFNNPFGPPIIQFPGGSEQMVTDFPQRPGLPTPTWHIDQEGGGMTLAIPNDPLPRPLKLIHLQYTADKAGGVPVSLPGGVAMPGGVAGHGGAWYTYEWTIEIRPNPPFENIWIPFPVSTNIEEVHVASICVPEPASLGLLALGALSLRRIRPARRER